MYIGIDPLYYSGTLVGLRNTMWGKFISQIFVDEYGGVRKRPFVSEVHFNYIKRTRCV